ncbi:Polyketide synthase dehydratase [Nonomuraea solani]|uniref:Polyketide synthase dehydratase n=1 Tax=Nonomuraea solani TaxID=1144553 RepID=A0A1H6DAD2_9ACTN|nr:SDR family NAD(P)-dependent oxidoreductase [Nonomuraea solani]SEG82142.1 Polyketide synthase dehydratase [Nonomuraea solani]
MTRETSIAVVGMGVVAPGASDPEELWDVLRGGRSMIGEPGRSRLDLGPFWSFDPDAEDRVHTVQAGYINHFTPHRRLAEEIREGDWDGGTDRVATWLRHCALQALEGVKQEPGDRVQAAVALSADTIQHLESATVRHGMRRRLADALSPQDATMALPAIARELDRHYRPAMSDRPTHLPDDVWRRAIAGLLPGECEMAVLTATCASGLMGMGTAIQALRSGTCDLALCGAAQELTPRSLIAMAKAGVLSGKARVRAFDHEADGTAFGEGAGCLVLKTLERAQRDGDSILGVLAGYGAASDGRGKSAGAPNPVGQCRAIERAWRTAGVESRDVGLIVCHATGTLAGDPVELEALASLFTDDRRHPVVGNKPMLSHLGTAAGMVSVLHALLALRHEVIPAQPFFTELPGHVELPASLYVPTEDIAWPAGGPEPRIAGVSSFGLGGSNTHLMVSDRPTQTAPEDRPQQEDDIVLVDWTACFPGGAGRDAVEAWLRGTAEPPEPEFGEDYPMPGFEELRIPPPVLQEMDRTELTALRMTGDLASRLGEAWDDLRDRTSIAVAHLGQMRAATLSTLRCYLPDCQGALASAEVPRPDAIHRAYQIVRDDLRANAPEVTADTLRMTVVASLIGGWIANYFDIHGPHMAVETGWDAGLSALRLAEQQLRHGEADAALVCGVATNSTPEFTAIVKHELPPGARLAEGGVLLALTRRSVAEQHRLRPLATISTRPGTEGMTAQELAPLCGLGRVYPGMDGLLALLGAADQVEIAPVRSDCPAVTVSPEHPEIVVRKRMTYTDLTDEIAPRTRPLTPALPDGTLVIADVESAERLDLPERSAVVTPRDGIEAVTEGRPPFDVRHVRVVADLGSHGRPEHDWGPDLRDLHDLAFAAMRAHLSAELSYAVLMIDAVRDGRPHPWTGLFTGLIKTLPLEVPGARCWAVLSDTTDLATGLAQLEEESAYEVPLDVVVRAGDRRLGYALAALDPPAHRESPITRDSVVVAVGGGTGVAAELMKALAGRHAPICYLIGRTPAPQDGGPAVPDRPAYIARERRSRPEAPVPDLVAEHQKLSRQATIAANVAAMARHSGPDRVRYVSCDITAGDALNAVIDTICDEHGQVDLLLNAASVANQAMIEKKDLADFQRGRDTKVLGYLNLRSAFEDRPPRLWANLASALGFMGWPGEIDYVVANDFLAAAAYWSANDTEFTLDWTTWDGVGIAGEPVLQEALRSLGITAFMTVAEGVTRFFEAIEDSRRPPVIVHLPEDERKWLAERAPRLPYPGPGQPAETFERTLSLDDGGCLAHHIIQGRALAPISASLDMAFDAAATMMPGMVPTGIRKLQAQAPIILTPQRPQRLTLTLSALGHDDLEHDDLEHDDLEHGEQARLHARITSDIRHPATNEILDRRLHTEFDLLMAERRPEPPRWQPPDPPPQHEIPNPLLRPNPVAYVTGPLACTTGHRADDAGAASSIEPRDRGCGVHRLPCRLFHGVFELANVVRTSDEHVPLLVLQSAEEIDLFTGRTDDDIFSDGPVRAFADPVGPGSIMVGVDADGSVLLRARGIRAAILGHFDLASGEFHEYTGPDYPTCDSELR